MIVEPYCRNSSNHSSDVLDVINSNGLCVLTVSAVLFLLVGLIILLVICVYCCWRRSKKSAHEGEGDIITVLMSCHRTLLPIQLGRQEVWSCSKCECT